MSYFNFSPSTNLGWECPKCGKCYSPTTSECLTCNWGPGVTTGTIEVPRTPKGKCPGCTGGCTSCAGSW